jgi:hypothetical protein
MLTFPAFQDRLIVLATGLVMVLGLAYIVNMMRRRGDQRSGSRNDKVKQ